MYTHTCIYNSFIWSMWKELRPSLHFNFNKVYSYSNIMLQCVIIDNITRGVLYLVMMWQTSISLYTVIQHRLTIIPLRSIQLSVYIAFFINDHTHHLQASNPFDELMHVVRLRASEVKAVMEPSTNHISDSVECLLKSDSAVVTYSWDSPGQ